MIRNLDKRTKYELAKILYYYTQNGKFADKKFILVCLNIICDFEQLWDYIKHVEFNPNKSIMAYYFKYKKIAIDPKLFNEYKKINLFEYNTDILLLLLHEIDHAIQHKKAEGSATDLEARLLRASFNFKDFDALNDYAVNSGMSIDVYNHYVKLFIKAYDKLYNCFPSERLAIFNSSGNISSIIKTLEPSCQKELLNKYNLECFNFLDYDYSFIPFIHDLKSPLKKFILKHDKMPSFKLVAGENITMFLQKEQQKLSLQERFVLGFPIDTFEEKKVEFTFKKGIYK